MSITQTDSKGRKTTFLRQRLVAMSSGNPLLLTEGIWHGEPDGYGNLTPDCQFSIEYRDPPNGLPLIDETQL